jgi:hypothetical protein
MGDLPAQTFERRGLLFAHAERSALEACAVNIINGTMSAYVFAPSANATVYFWEGELLEVWSPDHSLVAKVIAAARAARAILVASDASQETPSK